MSSYFDAFDREVAELARACKSDEDFLKNLELLEQRMVNDCELFAGDIETPEDVRQCIMAVISLQGIRSDKSGSAKAKEMAVCCKTSPLSRDMHSLWHDIARMRYEFRYAMVFDDPATAVKHRDEYEWDDKPLNRTVRPFEIRDAPAYCKKVLEKLAHGQDPDWEDMNKQYYP